MNKTSLVAGFAIFCAASAVGARSQGTKEYLIKVTSSIPGQAIEFEGAHLFNGPDPALHTVRQSTPCEARSNGQLEIGVFRKIKGDARLVVEITATEDGKPLNSSRTVDDGMIFGQNLLENVPSFTRSFSWARR